MIKNLGDTDQELDVDVVFGKDAVNVAAVAMELGSKPIDGATLRHCFKYFLYPLSDFHSFSLHRHKKCEPS